MPFRPDAHWLQQYVATHPEEAARMAPLREARAAKAVRTPVVEETGEAEAFRAALLTRAKAHDWSVHETWNASGPDRGYHCWLVKDGRLLRVEWHPETTTLSPAHERFNTRLALLPGVEVHIWHMTDLALIEATLT